MENKLELFNVLNDVNHYRLPKLFLAGFWIRLGAFLIDLVIINAIQQIVLNLTLYRFIGIHMSESFLSTLIELIIFVTYFYLLTQRFNGQTPGKMLVGIRVIPLKANQTSGNAYLFRELFGKVLFFYFPYIAVLLIFSYKKQHIIDLLVDTIVIREERLKEVKEYIQA